MAVSGLRRNDFRILGVNGEQKHVGYFKDEIQAAKAYDKAAKKYYKWIINNK